MRRAVIENVIHTGYSGHRIEITLSRDLNIVNVKYHTRSDFKIEEISSSKSVEKIIFQMDTLVTGYYTLQIKNEVDYTGYFAEKGSNDTTYYSIFNGKFKKYLLTLPVSIRFQWISTTGFFQSRVGNSSGCRAAIKQQISHKIHRPALVSGFW